MNSFAEIISLLLTTPAVFLSLLVLWYWRHEAEVSLKQGALRDATGWLVLGVVISFTGSILDNGYWGIAWTMDYIDHPSRNWWFQNGVWPNIPFRQLALLAAAYCHLRGALILTPSKGDKILKNALVGSFAVSVIAVSLLTVLKIANS